MEYICIEKLHNLLRVEKAIFGQPTSPTKCKSKFFSGGGAGMVTPSVLPPPYKQFLGLPTPILRCFWKDFLMTPIPYYPTSSIFHCYPHPSPPPPPLKFNQTLRQCIDPEVLTSKSCHSNLSTTVLLLVFRQGSSKFEFTVKGELTYWQDQFLIVHNSVQILYLKVLVQIDELFQTEAKEKYFGNLTCVPGIGGNYNIICNCA